MVHATLLELLHAADDLLVAFLRNYDCVCALGCAANSRKMCSGSAVRSSPKKEEARVHVLRVLAEPNAECRSEKKRENETIVNKTNKKL